MDIMVCLCVRPKNKCGLNASFDHLFISTELFYNVGI